MQGLTTGAALTPRDSYPAMNVPINLCLALARTEPCVVLRALEVGPVARALPVLAQLLQDAMGTRLRAATCRGTVTERLAVFLETLGCFLAAEAEWFRSAEAAWFEHAPRAQWQQVWPLIALKTQGPRAFAPEAELPLHTWLRTSGWPPQVGPRLACCVTPVLTANVAHNLVTDLLSSHVMEARYLCHSGGYLVELARLIYACVPARGRALQGPPFFAHVLEVAALVDGIRCMPADLLRQLVLDSTFVAARGGWPGHPLPRLWRRLAEHRGEA